MKVRALLVIGLLSMNSAAYALSEGAARLMFGKMFADIAANAEVQGRGKVACYRTVTNDSGYTKVKFVERLPKCEAPLMRLDVAKAWAEGLNAGYRNGGVSSVGFGYTTSKIEFGPVCNAKSKQDAGRGLLSDEELKLLDRNCRNMPRPVVIPTVAK